MESFYLELDLTDLTSLPIYLVKETPGSLLVKVTNITKMLLDALRLLLDTQRSEAPRVSTI